MRKSTKGIMTVAALVAMAGGVNADIIAQWNFDQTNLVANIGSGTATNVGGTSSAFAAGNGGGQGWNTSTYQSQSSGSGTAGVSFFVSTVGFEDISIRLDHRASGTRIPLGSTGLHPGRRQLMDIGILE